MKSREGYKPKGFQNVTPYLCVQGADKLLKFLKQTFKAEELGRYRRPDGTIAHAYVKIGESMVELGDVTEPSLVMPCMLHVYVPDADDAYQRAVKAGGASLHEPTDKDYGERSGAVKDMCGNHWYIATRIGATRGKKGK